MSNPLLSEALKALTTAPDNSTETRVHYADVIVKTAIMFAVTIMFAVVGWRLGNIGLLLVLPLSLAGVLVVFLAYRRPGRGPALPLTYAALEGTVVGSISMMFAAQYGSDIIITAVLATAVVFGVCLAVFSVPAVRESGQGRRFFTVALISFLLLSVVSMLAGVFFGVGGGWGFYGLGWAGIAIALVATALSAWSLVIDFGDVDRAVRTGAPETVTWTLALGLLVSTIWLYLNMLRLLSRR
jgi:uncharacterized YccA/Bax inhibitor family protein